MLIIWTSSDLIEKYNLNLGKNEKVGICRHPRCLKHTCGMTGDKVWSIYLTVL